MMSQVEAGKFVTPGDQISAESSATAGRGATQSERGIIATQAGFVKISEDVVTVEAAGDGPREIEVGDVIIGAVSRLQTKTAEVKIQHVEGKRCRDIPAEQLFADVFVAEIVDRFLPAPGDAMRTRDIIRGEIIQVKPVARISTKRKARYGVLHALCPACGLLLQPSSKVDDFNVACTRCDYTAYRALCADYGTGFFEEGARHDSLNRGGERWSPAAESRLSHDGARPYLSIMADHRRGETHEIPAEFLSSGGRGRGGRGERRRREMHKSECTLCGTGCEVPFKPTPGKPIRCKPCMEKVEDGSATQDELAKEREVILAAKEKALAAAGLKLFVGGVPYQATEDELREIFAEHGELKEVHIATDRETGNSRGFAFITYNDRAQGKKALDALKGTQMHGRRLSIQESKKSGDRDRGGRRGRGGGGRDRRRGGGHRRGGRRDRR